MELGAARTQTVSDVVQVLAISQSGESQTKKLIPARATADYAFATAAGDAALKLPEMTPIEQLGKDEFAEMHGRKIAAGCGR